MSVYWLAVLLVAANLSYTLHALCKNDGLRKARVAKLLRACGLSASLLAGIVFCLRGQEEAFHGFVPCERLEVVRGTLEYEDGILSFETAEGDVREFLDYEMESARPAVVYAGYSSYRRILWDTFYLDTWVTACSDDPRHEEELEERTWLERTAAEMREALVQHRERRRGLGME